jgi:hypothetical protein
MSGFIILLANLPLKPGQSDMKKGSFELCGIIVFGTAFHILTQTVYEKIIETDQIP